METKPMSIRPTTNSKGKMVYDLSIERDSGNSILILMAKKTIASNRADWQKLHNLCETVLTKLE